MDSKSNAYLDLLMEKYQAELLAATIEMLSEARDSANAWSWVEQHSLPFSDESESK